MGLSSSIAASLLAHGEALGGIYYFRTTYVCALWAIIEPRVAPGTRILRPVSGTPFLIYSFRGNERPEK
jgi:hypothetical protein